MSLRGSYSSLRDRMRISSPILTESKIISGTFLSKNNISLEIKHRIIPANRCYYGSIRQLSSSDPYRTSKLILCNTLIFPVLLYSIEGWTLLRANAAALRILKGKVSLMTLNVVRVNEPLSDIYVSILRLTTLLIQSQGIYLHCLHHKKWFQSGDQTQVHSCQQILLWFQWAIE